MRGRSRFALFRQRRPGILVVYVLICHDAIRRVPVDAVLPGISALDEAPRALRRETERGLQIRRSQ
jgi:hypothetical protein